MMQLNRNFGRALQINTKQIVRWGSTEGYAAQRVKYQAQLTEMRKVWQAEFVKRQEEKEQRLKEERRIMVQNKAVRIREERLASLIRQEADRKRKAESAQRLRQNRARKHLQWDKEIAKQNERYSKMAADLRVEAPTWLSYENLSSMITTDLFERDSATTGFVSRYSKHWRYQVESGEYSFEKMMNPGEFMEPALDRYERLEARRGTYRFKERQELSDYLNTMVSTGEEREKFQDLVTEFLYFDDKDKRKKEFKKVGVDLALKNHAWEAKWAARDKEELLHEVGMSKYLYDTKAADDYDAQNLKAYEEAGSDLDEADVFERRPSLNFGHKRTKDKLTGAMRDVVSDSDADLENRLSDSDTDEERFVASDALYSVSDSTDAAGAYRAAQLKGGADRATLDAVIATIDQVRLILGGQHTLSAAEFETRLTLLQDKLSRLEELLEKRRIEPESVSNALYEVHVALYRADQLKTGANPATVEAIIAAQYEVQEFFTDFHSNYRGEESEKQLRALHEKLLKLRGELDNQGVDPTWLEEAIAFVEFYASDVEQKELPDEGAEEDHAAVQALKADRAKLVSQRDSAASQRAQLHSLGADVSIIDAELAHLNDCIAHTDAQLDGEVEEDDSSGDEDAYSMLSPRDELAERLQAKLDRLSLQHAAVRAQLKSTKTTKATGKKDAKK